MPIEEGKKAPAFTLNDGRGKKVKLSDLAGKNVVVYFYPKDDTPGCTKEACGFRDLWKEIQKENTVVLGVSPDGAESHEKFRKKYKLPFMLLSDPDREVHKQFGTKRMGPLSGKRATFVIDTDRRLVRVIRSETNMLTHADEALEALKSLT